MSEPPPNPDACGSMADVRAGVDMVDRAILDLLAVRFAYMDAAARLKPRRDEVRDETRKARVIAAVHAGAEARGLPADALAAIWDDLVEASIAYELEAFDRR